MKYYVYISDSKVDMLFDQIPTKLSRKIAGELSLNLKVVSLKLQSNTPQRTRYEKLAMVIKYLEKYELVGSVASPLSLGLFVRGSARLKWTIIDSTVVWLGNSGEGAYCALTGSVRHLTSSAGDAQELSVSGSVGSISHISIVKAYQRALESTMDDLPGAVHGLDKMLTGSGQKLEYVAVVQADESLHGAEEFFGGATRLIVGSPLYVAQA